MKYNPKVNEKIAALPRIAETHPLAPSELVQGNLKLLKLLEEYLKDISSIIRLLIYPVRVVGQYWQLMLVG